MYHFSTLNPCLNSFSPIPARSAEAFTLVKEDDLLYRVLHELSFPPTARSAEALTFQ